MSQVRTLDPRTMYAQMARIAGLPEEQLMDAATLLRRMPEIAEQLRAHVIGQERALEVILHALQRRLVHADTTRPVLSLLCVGPSGVGKTETAIQLARLCLGDPGALVRLDGSEYSEGHSIARLIGAPPGYIGHGHGGALTEAVRRRPRSVVLFDEVEKAAPEVVQVFLQIMDAGRCTDTMGQTVDFRHTMVLFTSNLGNRSTLGVPDRHSFTRSVLQAVRNHLAPEFLGRLDDIVIYHHLDEDALLRIVALRLADRAESLIGVAALTADDEVLEFLAREAASPNSGAREVERVLDRHIDPCVAQLLEAGTLSAYEPRPVHASLVDGRVRLGFRD